MVQHAVRRRSSPYLSCPLCKLNSVDFPLITADSISQVLFFYGSSLRRRSPLCSKILSPEQDAVSNADGKVHTPRLPG